MIIEFSWWGICKQFSEEKSVYTLDYEYFEGHHDYGEINRYYTFCLLVATNFNNLHF